MSSGLFFMKNRVVMWFRVCWSNVVVIMGFLFRYLMKVVSVWLMVFICCVFIIVCCVLVIVICCVFFGVS